MRAATGEVGLQVVRADDAVSGSCHDDNRWVDPTGREAIRLQRGGLGIPVTPRDDVGEDLEHAGPIRLGGVGEDDIAHGLVAVSQCVTVRNPMRS